MTNRMIDSIQEKVSDSTVKKIDPNTEETVNDGVGEDKLNQAAIPAVLISLYKFTRSDEGAQEVMTAQVNNQWIDEIFGDNKENVIANVASYSGAAKQTVAAKLEEVAKHAVNIVREEQPVSVQDVKNLFAAERSHILVHLHPSLHMGEVLGDETIDDGVNKMEGPVSSLMTKIGNIFSQSGKGEQA